MKVARFRAARAPREVAFGSSNQHREEGGRAPQASQTGRRTQIAEARHRRAERPERETASSIRHAGAISTGGHHCARYARLTAGGASGILRGALAPRCWT